MTDDEAFDRYFQSLPTRYLPARSDARSAWNAGRKLANEELEAKHAKLLEDVRAMRAGIENGTCYTAFNRSATNMILDGINTILKEHGP